MSPPREHPGSDTSFADPSRGGELRARLDRAGSSKELTIADLFGGRGSAPQGGSPAAKGSAVVSANDVLEWLPTLAPSSAGATATATTVALHDRGGDHDSGPNRADPARVDTADSATNRLRMLAPPPRLEDLGLPTVVRPAGLRNRLHRRRYGVAPFVRPSARRSRRKRRRDYRQLGFVELTPEKLHLRHKILPRTVFGASLLLVSLGVGAAFSGASFYAYYDWRTTQSEAQITDYAERFEQTFTGAQEQLELTRNQAIEEMNTSLEPLRTWAGDSNAVAELPAKVGSGVFFVRTVDTAGRPSVGSAFVVSSSPTESLLLTSFQVVAAVAAKPAPPLTLEKNGESFTAVLWAWDADNDLALLKTSRGSLAQLEWAPDAERSQTAGRRVYAISGSGGQGATASPGLAVDASQLGIRHDTPLSPEFRGAPLTNAKGQVLGVVSTSYAPTGIEVGELPFAPFITSACQRVLRCPDAVTATASPAAPAAPPAPPAPSPAGSATTG